MVKANDPLEGGQDVKPSQVSFSKIGDFVKGTFTNKKEINRDGKTLNLYEIKGEVGTYHEADVSTDENGNKITKVKEPGIDIVKGRFYQIWGGKDQIDNLFRNAKFGQIVALRFEKSTPSKKAGNSPFKEFKTVLFKMDPEYMGENSDVEDSAREVGLVD